MHESVDPGNASNGYSIVVLCLYRKIQYLERCTCSSRISCQSDTTTLYRKNAVHSSAYFSSISTDYNKLKYAFWMSSLHCPACISPRWGRRARFRGSSPCSIHILARPRTPDRIEFRNGKFCKLFYEPIWALSNLFVNRCKKAVAFVI